MSFSSRGRLRAAWVASLVWVTFAAGWLGCSEQDIPGTYDVQILVERARAPIEATMIVTTSYLESGSHSYDSSSEWDEISGEPNSCLILPSSDPVRDAPRAVMLFESRLRGGEFLAPVTVFETDEQRMEITQLSFFAGTAGGEIVVYEADETRPGRIVGSRVGGPDGMRCLLELAKFRERLEAPADPS